MSTVVEFYISDKDRKNTIKLLSEHFDKKNCVLIEKGLYDFSNQYCQSNNNNLIMAQSIYRDCTKNLIFNCKQNNRTMKEIKQKIIKKKFNAYNLAFLRPDELDQDNWHKIILRKNTTEDKLTNLPTIEWKKCVICKNKEYFYRQEQTRSADEPMTTYYYCKHCGKTYSVNN